MAKRRGKGEGTIYQRQDGRWTGSISLEGGRRKVIYGKTRKEVQEQLKTVLHQQQQGIWAEEVGFEPTKAIHLTRFPVVLTRPL